MANRSAASDTLRQGAGHLYVERPFHLLPPTLLADSSHSS